MPCVTFRNKLFLNKQLSAPSSNPQVRGPTHMNIRINICVYFVGLSASHKNVSHKIAIFFNPFHPTHEITRFKLLDRLHLYYSENRREGNVSSCLWTLANHLELSTLYSLCHHVYILTNLISEWIIMTLTLTGSIMRNRDKIKTESVEMKFIW